MRHDFMSTADVRKNSGESEKLAVNALVCCRHCIGPLFE